MKDSQTFEKPKFLSPVAVLEEIGLESGDVVVDYGSGSGHWTIAAAKAVLPKGVVYAYENNIEMLQLLKNLAEIRRLNNIEIFEVDIEKGKPAVEVKADLVILANVLHSVEDKAGLVERSFDMLKEEGSLLIVDWSNEKTLFGPPSSFRLDQEALMTMAENSGYNFVCTVEAGWHHFGMLFEKGGKNGEKK